MLLRAAGERYPGIVQEGILSLSVQCLSHWTSFWKLLRSRHSDEGRIFGICTFFESCESQRLTVVYDLILSRSTGILLNPSLSTCVRRPFLLLYALITWWDTVDATQKQIPPPCQSQKRKHVLEPSAKEDLTIGSRQKRQKVEPPRAPAKEISNGYVVIVSTTTTFVTRISAFLTPKYLGQ